jgi:hypothetical protein
LLGLVIVVAALARDAAADPDPEPVRWRTYFAFRNDAIFTDLDPPVDDFGFTHDNVLSIVRTRGELGFGGRAIHRWITSRTDFRRWDQVELVGLVERHWPYLPIRLDTVGRFGPTLGGNFGGRYFQNGWHTLTGTGGTLETNSLADDYPADRRIGILAGARGRAQLGDDDLHGYAILDGQLGFGGGGVSTIETVLGGAASTRHVGAHVELAITRYRVSDEWMALPGGHRPGWQLEWRAGVHVAWSRFRLIYQYRANESGSGEPIGVLAFEARRP